MSEVLTIGDVAELLLCDKETVAEYLNRGDLPGLKFGRSWVVPRDAFFQRLNEMALENAATRRGSHYPATTGGEKKKPGRPRFTGS